MTEKPESVEIMEEDNQDKKELYTPGPNAIDISPNGDRSVLKEIIKEGRGVETPKKGNKVFVNYTGRLIDGTVFDSSHGRDVFDFVLGEGHVIKAWDIGVSTMKEGEICILTCHPDYAYGKAGSPPKIPENATLIFEVELLRWQLEDLSTAGDNGVLRSIITKGEGSDMPNDEASVEINIKGKFGDAIFDERDVKFQLGEGYECNVPEGLEIALKKFKKGETSKIILAPNYAFGSEGKPEFNIPPNSEIEYEVTLKSFEKAKEIWELDTPEKLEESEKIKNKGTEFFKEEKFDKAMNQYKKIVTYLQYENDLKGSEKEKKDAVLLAAYLNLAACHLKLKDYAEAINSCEKALEMDSKNVKGLFRRGQALLGKNDFDLAKQDFQRVIEVDPDNKAAKKQIYICTEKLKQQLEKEKRIYRSIFEKMAKEGEAVNINEAGDAKVTNKMNENVEPDSTTDEKMEISDPSEPKATKA